MKDNLDTVNKDLDQDVEDNSAFNLAGLIKMPKDKALEAIKASGMKVRIVSEDGVPFMGTADYRTDRVKVDIVGGVVVEARLG